MQVTKNKPFQTEQGNSFLQQGITLVELIVAMAVSMITVVGAFWWFNSVWKRSVRQNEIQQMEVQLREATKALNSYLRACGTGSGDAFFYDPLDISTAPIDTLGGLKRVISVSGGVMDLYGNFTGNSTVMKAPMITDLDRVKVSNPFIFTTGTSLYINGGSTQEVQRIKSISADSMIVFENNAMIAYPRGTLIFPLERIQIDASGGKSLKMNRYTAFGTLKSSKAFIPSGRSGDDVIFTITGNNIAARRMDYTLTFAINNNSTSKTRVQKSSDQVVYMRGF